MKKSRGPGATVMMKPRSPGAQVMKKCNQGRIYQKPWRARAYLVLRMRLNGIQELQISSKFSIYKFSRMFPDQGLNVL